MGFAVTLLCLVPWVQLRVEPVSVAVGSEIRVTAYRAGAVLPGVEVVVELPDGAVQPCGLTSAEGALGFVPLQPGRHVFAATVDAVRCVTMAVVTPVRRTWLLAFGAVPLGLALLWCNLSRLRGRRAP